jgi:hypothetical protein
MSGNCEQADHNGRTVQVMNRLRPLKHWDLGSNPTWSMDVRVRLFRVYAVLCAGSSLATGWSPPPSKSPTYCVKDEETEKVAQVQQRAEEPRVNEL